MLLLAKPLSILPERDTNAKSNDNYNREALTPITVAAPHSLNGAASIMLAASRSFLRNLIAMMITINGMRAVSSSAKREWSTSPL